jgi:hypothetical protein
MSGGGFSLQKGVGTVSGRSLGVLSNIYETSLDTSSTIKAR